MSTILSPLNDVASDEEGKMARMSLGWNIFPSPRLHGANWRSVIGHQGVFMRELFNFIYDLIHSKDWVAALLFTTRNWTCLFVS
jgi:hypothetical protein